MRNQQRRELDTCFHLLPGIHYVDVCAEQHSRAGNLSVGNFNVEFVKYTCMH
jgi:hypothetical protein